MERYDYKHYNDIIEIKSEEGNEMNKIKIDYINSHLEYIKAIEINDYIFESIPEYKFTFANVSKSPKIGKSFYTNNTTIFKYFDIDKNGRIIIKIINKQDKDIIIQISTKEIKIIM